MDRIQFEEVRPRSSTLSGAVQLEWSSSANRYFIPGDSYMVVDFEFQKSNGAGDAWENITGDANYASAVPAFNAGANFFSQLTLQANNVLVGTISNPAQQAAVHARTEVSKDYASTTGSVEMLGSATERKTNTLSIQTAEGVNRKTFSVVLRPNFGFLRGGKSWPGLRWALTCNIHPSYTSRILTSLGAATEHPITTGAAPATVHDFRTQITGVRYYAAHASPVESVPIPRQVIAPLYELSSSSQQLPNGLVAGTVSTLQFTVPPSSYKLYLTCQQADAGESPIGQQKEVSEFRGGVGISDLQLSHGGFSLPQVGYSKFGDEPERPFADYVRSTLAAQDGKGSLDSVQTWRESPIAVFRFAKPPQDASTEVTVRISFSGNLNVAMNVGLYAAHQCVAVIDFDGSGLAENVNYSYLN